MYNTEGSGIIYAACNILRNIDLEITDYTTLVLSKQSIQLVLTVPFYKQLTLAIKGLFEL